MKNAKDEEFADGIGSHFSTGTNGLLAESYVSCCMYASVEILLNQAFSLPPNWNGLHKTRGDEGRRDEISSTILTLPSYRLFLPF